MSVICEILKRLTSINMESGVAREDLWITSKLWNDMHGEGDVLKSCQQSLEDLGLDYLANMESICSDPLSVAEMHAISRIDRGARLIKGHVFLWQGAKDWRDLWDLDGTITA